MTLPFLPPKLLVLGKRKKKQEVMSHKSYLYSPEIISGLLLQIRNQVLSSIYLRSIISHFYKLSPTIKYMHSALVYASSMGISLPRDSHSHSLRVVSSSSMSDIESPWVICSFSVMMGAPRESNLHFLWVTSQGP